MNSPIQLLTRVQDAAVEVPKVTGRQLRRARLKMQSRRLDSKLHSEMAALGEDLYDGCEAGKLKVELPALQDRFAAIERLRAERAALGRTEGLDTRLRESMADTDYNATPEASAEQVVDEAADRRAGSLAEQGGEG